MSTLKMTLLGTGTSQGIPVIGCPCKVCTSPDPRDQRLRSAALIEWRGKNIVIDTGPDFRQQMLRAKVTTLEAVLITHEHNDHVVGLDDVRPFNFRTGTDLPVYATKQVQKELKIRFAYVFAENKYPGAPMVKLKTIEPSQPFTIGDLVITPIAALHGKMPVLGFRVGDFAYLTDVNYLAPTERAKLKGLKVLVLDALHRQKHHSHLHLAKSIEWAQEIGATQTYFTHLSHQMGTHAAVSDELPAAISIGYDGLSFAQEWQEP